MNQNQSQNQSQIQIDIDDATAKGQYANLAFISHSETEFVLDFIFLQPQNPKAKVLSRIITSPVHAKRFVAALKDNIDKFETRFGPIRAENPAETTAKPAGYYQ